MKTITLGRTGIKVPQNGFGALPIQRVSIEQIQGLDNLKSKLQLLTKLNEAKVSIKDEGNISADDIERELGL